MSYQNILLEATLKLKTKVIIFSGVSLFIGLAETLPTKLSLIGFDFAGNEKILGWFLIIITLSLFINFLLLAYLDVAKYFRNSFLSKDIEKLTGNTLGLTDAEINEEYYRRQNLQEEFEEVNRTENDGSLESEARHIDVKRKILERNFDKVHFKFYNYIELFFNFIIPVILAIISIVYLYNFLMK